MESQSVDNLKGEVEFREKLARQHVTGEDVLPNYYGKDEHDKILLDRVHTTVRDMTAFKDQFPFSPFIELGAERCHRALVLTNDFNAQGFAVDISFHQLKTADHFGELFNRPKMPIRVCCDANNLPFRSRSFPFAFCYEFLHHFPSPKPILKEVCRTMADGVFFFSEEPFKRPKVTLYKQRHQIYSKEYLGKNAIVRFLEKYISDEYCDEREYGIIENDDISLREWIESVAVFQSREMTVGSLKQRIRSRLGDKIGIRNVGNLLFGGTIGGVCRKQTDDAASTPPTPKDLTQLLVCPNCASRSVSSTTDAPSLVKNSDAFNCPACGSSFPVIDDVIMLLPTELFRELYPEFAG